MRWTLWTSRHFSKGAWWTAFDPLLRFLRVAIALRDGWEIDGMAGVLIY